MIQEKKKSVCISHVRTSDSSFSDNVVANLQKQIDECKVGLTAKGTIIDSTTAQVLQLSEGSNVDDALLKLAMPEGKYALQITLLTPGNRPIPNVPITGITTITGAAVSTDANGKAFGFATSNPVTVTADLSTFLDLTDECSQSFSLTSGVVNQGVITATRASEMQKLITASGTFHFSPDVAEYDWSAIGGGYNGGKGSGHSTQNTNDSYVDAAGGKGGNAGGVINQANVTVPSDFTLNVIVGGANGGKSSVNGTQTPQGASGGAGGYVKEDSDSNITKRNSSNGASTVDNSFLYPPTSVGGAGGGGTAYAVYNPYSSSGTYSQGEYKGGSPGGGDGGSVGSSSGHPGNNGTSYGSGGGGGGCSTSGYQTLTFAGGSGKQGAVGFMWRFKS